MEGIDAVGAGAYPARRPTRPRWPATRSGGLSPATIGLLRVGDGQLIQLTTVEFRLLVALVRADGRVLTRDQLLDLVYGQDDSEILDRTIDVHVGRLRDKLGDDAAAPRYVATVRGVGYRAAPLAAAEASASD